MISHGWRDKRRLLPENGEGGLTGVSGRGWGRGGGWPDAVASASLADIGEADSALDVHVFGDRRATQVGVDEQNASFRVRQVDVQVGARRALAFTAEGK